MRRKIGAAILLAVLALAGGATGLALYVSQALRPMPETGQEVRVVIPPGSTPAQVAGMLERSGIVRDGRIFTYYLKYKRQGSKFQAGEYAMAPGLTPDAIIAKLNAGDTVKQETVRVTIPEGYTVPQIVEKVAKTSDKPSEELLRWADAPPPFQGTAIPALPEVPQQRHKLEGYLFPETYEFKKGTTPEEMLLRMLSETDAKLAGLGADWQTKLQGLGLNVHQLLTVASLIEREVALDEERPIVAGVIYNRLKRSMPLQLDATIQYLFDKPKDRLTEKDLQLESPYNTYLHPGLPPGPIASPSLASIQAALSPQANDYLFYVTKKDGSKGHLFAVTYEEHKKNIAASKAQEGK